MNIAVLDWSSVSVDNDISPDIFKPFGNVNVYPNTPPELTAAHIADAQIVLCNKTLITREIISECKDIKYIGLFATGYNNVDINAAEENNITVCNAGSYSTNAVAQHTFALMLNHFSKVALYDADVKDGKWINSPNFSYFPHPITELAGKTLSIIGFGNIGRKVAEIAHAFGMNVAVHTRTPEMNQPPYQFVSLEDAFKIADVLTIHCPLTEDTRGLVCMNQLKAMKKSAFLINTARGPIVCEKDLAFALDNGMIAGAALDVLEKEPMLKDNPLRFAENCTITPHVAWAAFETRMRLVNTVTDNIKAFLDGNPVNKIV